MKDDKNAKRGFNRNNLKRDIVEIDPEELIKWNPKIKIRGTRINGFETDDITELSIIGDKIVSRPELAEVTAVKTGRVYVTAEGIPSGASFFVRIGNYAKCFYLLKE